MSEQTSFTLGAEERALLCGDLSRLTEQQRAELAARTCASLGLNPYTKPFEYIVVKGQGNEERLILYATKSCTEQLRSSRKVSLEIRAREDVGDSYVVTARATLPDGRTDESIGAVSIRNVPFFDRDAKRWSKKDLQGDALCNALMKAETKSKRRVTLSICGLGFLDESEIETIPEARLVSTPTPQAQAPVALNPAAVQPTVADAMKAQQVAPIPEAVLALGKQLGKLAPLVARDVQAAQGDIDTVRKAYEAKIAEKNPRGAQAPVEATVTGNQTESAVAIAVPVPTSQLDEGGNPAPEASESLPTGKLDSEDQEEPLGDQTQAVVSLMEIFEIQRLAFPTPNSRMEYCAKIVGRDVRHYSDLSIAELGAICKQLVRDEQPTAQKATQAQIQALQQGFKDAKIVAQVENAETYKNAMAAKAGREESLRLGRLAAASKWIGREVASFNDLTSDEAKKIYTITEKARK